MAVQKDGAGQRESGNGRRSGEHGSGVQRAGEHAGNVLRAGEHGSGVQRAGEHVRGVLCAALVCGMGIQILLGLVWLIKNMGGQQSFRESGLLLTGESAAHGFYSGILYRGLARLLAFCPWILYGIQLAAAVIAAYGLLSCFLGKEKKALGLLGALALATVPQALQCHLAVLPWSLGTSLLVGETALWKRAWEYAKGQDNRKDDGRKSALAMLLLWLLLLLILPVYAWFAFPMLAVFLWRRGKRGNHAGVCGLTAFLALLCCVTVNWGWNPADWNRKLAADALSRVGWPHFQTVYETFPQPLHDEVGLVTAREVSAYADGVERVLIPRLEARYTPKETDVLLWKLAGICLGESSKTVLKNIIWDMAAYHATPPVLAMQLKGRAYDAYSGVNYEQMRSRAPLLTRYYVTYGSGWWWAMLALAALITVCGKLESGLLPGRGKKELGESEPLPERGKKGLGESEPLPERGKKGLGESEPLPERKKRKQEKNSPWGKARKFLQCWLPVWIGAEWMILYFVFEGSGIMDYKKTLWVTILWYVAALSRLADRKRGKV